ncbi:hypothetical protein PPYC1_22860 [Paenibacillus polymyxa]|nr:hypothetical protein PPYC1_22860 [Paenibacillus polymyxa]
MICILLFLLWSLYFLLVTVKSRPPKRKKLYKNENGDIVSPPPTYDDRESFVSASKKDAIQPCEATGGG